MKHLSVSMSVKQNLFVSVFVHKCLMMLNYVEYTSFKMFLTQMSNYLFVISFQLMFYKTLRYRLARALSTTNKHMLYPTAILFSPSSRLMPDFKTFRLSPAKVSSAKLGKRNRTLNFYTCSVKLLYQDVIYPNRCQLRGSDGQ